jgi:hypothetical protein
MNGQLLVQAQFPSSLNVNVVNQPTVSMSALQTLGEKVYNVTATSQQFPTIDIPAGTKGAQIQYLSEDITHKLNTRTDGLAATTGDAITTGLGSITLESLADVQKFRFVGSVGSQIKVIFRG